MRKESVEVRRDSESRGDQKDVAGDARLAAAERLGSMEVEDVPELAELKRQFSEAHGPLPGKLPSSEGG